MATVYTSYIKLILEYACPVWHSSITKEQIHSIERVQKRVCRIILGSQYNNYYDALVQLKIQKLEVRRSELFIKFGRKLLGTSSTCRFRDMLPPQREDSFQLRKSTTSSLIALRCNTSNISAQLYVYLP